MRTHSSVLADRVVNLLLRRGLEVEERRLEALDLGRDAGEVPEGASVDVVDGEDVLADLGRVRRSERLDGRRGGGGPRGEGERLGSTLERGERLLEVPPVGVGRARVLFVGWGGGG